MAGTPSSSKVSHPQSERAHARKGSKFPQMLTKLAEADPSLRISRSEVGILFESLIAMRV
jgi:hypothetical protein